MTRNNLSKSITFTEAFALVVGTIIGAGIFLKPGIVFSNAGSPFMGIMAWIVGGVITLASALTIAEIASTIPKTGGLYVYLEELYGEVWGFLLGWVQTVISYPASAAALTIAFSIYANFFIPMSSSEQKLLSIGILVFITIMNIIATKFGGILQILSTIGKLIPLAAIIIFGMLDGSAHDFRSVTVLTEGAGFGAAILGTLWAYDGWIDVTNIAGELKNPAKEMPRAIILGVLFIISIYVLISVAMLNVMPIEQITSSAMPTSDIAVLLFGNNGAAFITAGILISVFGSLNGHILIGARVPLVMGQRRQLPFSSHLSKIHRIFGTPANALLLEGLLAIIYIFSGTFHALTDLLVFVLWIFFVMGVFGIFILRSRRSINKKQYHVPLYPLTPLIGILGGIYILYSTIQSSPFHSMIGIGITLAGLPVFYYLKRKY